MYEQLFTLFLIQKKHKIFFDFSENSSLSKFNITVRGASIFLITLRQWVCARTMTILLYSTFYTSVGASTCVGYTS